MFLEITIRYSKSRPHQQLNELGKASERRRPRRQAGGASSKNENKQGNPGTSIAPGSSQKNQREGNTLSCDRKPGWGHVLQRNHAFRKEWKGKREAIWMAQTKSWVRQGSTRSWSNLCIWTQSFLKASNRSNACFDLNWPKHTLWQLPPQAFWTRFRQDSALCIFSWKLTPPFHRFRLGLLGVSCPNSGASSERLLESLSSVTAASFELAIERAAGSGGSKKCKWIWLE